MIFRNDQITICRFSIGIYCQKMRIIQSLFHQRVAYFFDIFGEQSEKFPTAIYLFYVKIANNFPIPV